MFIKLSNDLLKLLKSLELNKRYTFEELNSQLNFSEPLLFKYLNLLSDYHFIEIINCLEEKDKTCIGFGNNTYYEKTVLGEEYLKSLIKEKYYFIIKSILVPILVTLFTEFLIKKLLKK